MTYKCFLEDIVERRVDRRGGGEQKTFLRGRLDLGGGTSIASNGLALLGLLVLCHLDDWRALKGNSLERSHVTARVRSRWFAL
jgi:hypothetical protein